MGFEVLSNFPYLKTGNYIFDKYYGEISLTSAYKKDWPTRKQTELWKYYKAGIESGDIAPVDVNTSWVNVNYLAALTPYNKAHIAWWLGSVQNLAELGEIDVNFYTGEKAKTGFIHSIQKEMGDFLTGTGKTVQITLAVTAGALVLYLAAPLLKGTRRRLT